MLSFLMHHMLILSFNAYFFVQPFPLNSSRDAGEARVSRQFKGKGLILIALSLLCKIQLF